VDSKNTGAAKRLPRAHPVRLVRCNTVPVRSRHNLEIIKTFMGCQKTFAVCLPERIKAGLEFYGGTGGEARSRKRKKIFRIDIRRKPNIQIHA
jgi:hypothetical protein